MHRFLSFVILCGMTHLNLIHSQFILFSIQLIEMMNVIFLQSLEVGAQKTPDNLSGFLSGFWINSNLHISGFRVSTDSSHKQFEQEFDSASSYLPAGKFLLRCTLFL